MIAAEVEEGAADNVTDYLEGVRKRVLAGIYEGMKEAMHGLDSVVASKLFGDPVHSRTGELLDAVLRGVHVRQTSAAIIGEVRPQVSDPKKHNLPLWLDFGHEFPGKRRRSVREQLARLSAEDRVPAYPFMNPSIHEYGPTIIEIIQEKVANAVNVE